jgi:hypothetical protein
MYKIMKYSIFIYVLLLTAISVDAASKKIVIPLNEIRNKSHVTVAVNNLEITNILIDTGFSFDGLMIYNPDYKDSLDLTNARQIKIPGAGSGEPSYASMLDSADFKLGTMAMRNQRIIMLASDTYRGFPSNGIIGYSIFGHYITQFDYDNNTMTLCDTNTLEIDTSWTELPIYFKENNIPWLDASVVIKDEPPIALSMYIDYAAGDAVLILEKPNMKVSLPEETVDVHLGRGLSGDIYGKTGDISKLIIGPYALKNIKASFADARVRSKQDNADAVLGIGSLRRFNLIFDYTNKKLYLKPNKHFNEPY